jgi:uracil-DNA glycosylase
LHISLQQLIPNDWQLLLGDYLESPAWHHLCGAFNQEYKVHGLKIRPDREKLFYALQLTPVDSVRVVILGQDPYHSPALAQGLAFSIPKTIPIQSREFPSSLRNMNKALVIEGFGSLRHGDLSHWAKQGVLLLNTALSVRLGEANSHAQLGWKSFIEVLIQKISSKKDALVWLLWGNHAQSLEGYINQDMQHYFLRASHPSGLSVYKTSNPFIYPGDQKSCGHFSNVNNWLIKHNEKIIDWVNENTN